MVEFVADMVALDLLESTRVASVLLVRLFRPRILVMTRFGGSIQGPQENGPQAEPAVPSP